MYVVVCGVCSITSTLIFTDFLFLALSVGVTEKTIHIYGHVAVSENICIHVIHGCLLFGRAVWLNLHMREEQFCVL